MDNLYALCPVHGPAEAAVCAACQKPTCLQCSLQAEPDVYLCADCVVKLQAQDTSPLFEDFWNPKKAPVTFALAAVLLLLYAASTGLTGTAPMPWVIERVNLDVSSVLVGLQLDRLLWANLFHASLLHIATNTFALLIFGQLLERLVGSRWVLAWLLLGLIATDAATLWWGPKYSLGASGMAYALQTAFIVVMVRRELALKTQPLSRALRSFGGYVLLMVVVNLWYAPIVNIAGHAGGSLAGALSAGLFPLGGQPKGWPWWQGLLAVGAVLLLWSRFWLGPY